ncbi:MAG: hypothetical protein EOO16_01715 [Chitinophagaceae bacterium]|nr:MAG: hypothetical protein EOO16_01715 [Chitinophagaceae bacterium]
MKQTITVFLLLFGLAASAQRTELRAGAVASFFGKSGVGDGFGGELYVGERWGVFSAGLNLQAVHTSHGGVYAPITASIGLTTGPITFHVDPGFLIHNQSVGKYEEKGRAYFGSGIRITGEDGLYVNLQYGKHYTRIDDGSKTSGTSAVALSIGYQFGGKN